MRAWTLTIGILTLALPGVGCGESDASHDGGRDAGLPDGAGDGGPGGPTLYVSPSGSDDAPGTIDRPLRTIAHARDLVRTLRASASSDIVVFLRGGTYVQPSTLTFGPDDSGAGGHDIIYQAYGNEVPVVSGGQTISSWTLVDAGRNLWRASVSATLASRQLYVNGVRATRARSSAGLPGSPVRTATGYTISGTSLQSWSNPGDLELVYTGGAGTPGAQWTESRCGVESITGDASSTTITMRQPCFSNGINKGGGQDIRYPTSIENSLTLLDEPGEWYLDRAAGALYYMPRPGEDLASATVILPVVEELVSGRGEAGRPVHNLQFKGITFAYATWLRPSGGDGFIEIQANYIVVGSAGAGLTAPANVFFHYAENVRFERNVFAHLGAQGIALDLGSRGNVIVGNVVTDISGTGIRIGDVTDPNPTAADQCSGNQVIDNYIHDVPVEYHGGIGLQGGYVAGTKFAHNEIARLPYSGISLGWGWGQSSYARDNEVGWNHIHHHVQLLGDGGGVYTLSAQAPSATVGRSSVHDNYIHDQTNVYGALYHDEGSAYMDTYRNVLASVPNWLFIWTSSIHDISAHDNFSDTPNLRNDGTNISLSNNYTGGPPWPPAAQAVIDAAGLEAPYRDLL